MQLAGAEHALFRVDALDGVEMDLVQFHVRRVPVGRGTFCDDLTVGLPGFEIEGAIPDKVFRAGPGRAFALQTAKLINDANGDRIPRVVIHSVKEERGALPQGQFEGVLVEGLESGLGEVIDLAQEIVLRADHVE